MRVASLVCASMLAACGAPRAAKSSGPVPVIAIDDDLPGEAPPKSHEAFACRPGRVGDGAEIRLEIRSVTANAERSEERSSRAAYTMRILALSGGEVSRAEVALERLEPERFSDGRQQMAWHTALEQGWVERETPFELARTGGDETWCFAEGGKCKTSEPSAREFIAALGETLSLVTRPELEAQLDGKDSDGNLELRLSEALSKRASLGVVEGGTATAAQQGRRFPAVFRVPLHDLSPQPSPERDLSAKLRIDQACRLRSLTTVLRTGRSDYAGLHELEWTITPEW